MFEKKSFTMQLQWFAAAFIREMTVCSKTTAQSAYKASHPSHSSFTNMPDVFFYLKGNIQTKKLHFKVKYISKTNHGKDIILDVSSYVGWISYAARCNRYFLDKILSSSGVLFVSDWQPPLILVRFTSNFLCMWIVDLLYCKNLKMIRL